ncbi:hypothetical protein D7294_25335 [Streptomyces hoynatensis]|uniref:Uncharacterized protein n=1 Tax=Streptomyces hoynatensis TaxID=1141874 RepID=A0A3A9YSA2_9ACTN|nr:hypothetical protein D7294_25335 [Streptomyces hoynatensis]
MKERRTKEGTAGSAAGGGGTEGDGGTDGGGGAPGLGGAAGAGGTAAGVERWGGSGMCRGPCSVFIRTLPGHPAARWSP